MIFDDRAHAARLLAERLEAHRDQHPLVLAIPRGAVPMGRIIAEAIGGELDVVLVRKLRAPENPELAIGSIDDTGSVYLDPGTRDLWTPSYLVTEKKVQLETLRWRRDTYRRTRPAIDPAGRVVIVIDDGVATGSTMIAALRATRARKPAQLIAAMAVAAPAAIRRIREEADDVIFLEAPSTLIGIGLHFRDFTPVSDEDAVRVLEATPRATAPTAPPPAA